MVFDVDICFELYLFEALINGSKLVVGELFKLFYSEVLAGDELFEFLPDSLSILLQTKDVLPVLLHIFAQLLQCLVHAYHLLPYLFSPLFFLFLACLHLRIHNCHLLL